MKISRLTYLAFVLAVSLRLVILLSSRPFIFGGDSYSYVALSLEINRNSYLIPFRNSIHYPGTEFIFPPLIPYIFSPILPMIGTFDTIATLTAVDIFLGSIPVFLVSIITFKLRGKNAGIVSGFVYATFPPFMYLDTWGDTAQLLGFVLFLLLLLCVIEVIRTHRTGRNFYAGILLLILLGYAHDLSFFFSLFFLIITIISLFVWNKLTDESVIRISPILVMLIVGGAIGSLWYVLHPAWLSFLFYNFISGKSHNLTFSVSGIAGSIDPLFAVPFGYMYFGFLFFALLAVAWFYSFRVRWSRDEIPIDALLIASIIPAVLLIFNTVLFSRFLYFASIGYSFVGSIFLADILSYKRNSISRLRKKIHLFLKIGVVLVIAMYLSLSVVINAESHSYYANGEGTGSSFAQNVMLSEWILSNDPHGQAIAAPQEIGFIIMAYAQVPVLVNENSSLLTQKNEVTESIAAGELISLPSNLTLVEHLANEYSIIYIVSNNTSSSSLFQPVFSNSFYTVYKITVLE